MYTCYPGPWDGGSCVIGDHKNKCKQPDDKSVFFACAAFQETKDYGNGTVTKNNVTQ